MSDLPTKTYAPEFLQAMIADYQAEQAGATPEDSSGVQAKEDAMSEIERFTPGNFGHMLWDKNGGWVRYQDHLAEVERLTVERDKAQAGDDVALSALTSVLRERDAAQAEVERLQNSANLWQHDAQQLTLTVDGLKRELHEIRPEAHLLRAEVKGLIRERNEVRNAAQIEATQLRAEVERLTQELEGRRATNQRVIAERDAAQAEVERLRANGQAMLDTSRPSDETIWWKAFNSFLRDDSLTIEEVADQAQAALTIYRARWPR